jgi:nucleoside-diphosphate-sugar epimerase
MRVLLTGATGFLGAHVARLLVQQGCQVFALARRGSDLGRLQDVHDALHLVTGDVLDGEQMAEVVQQARPELCLHLAWYAEPGVYLSSPLNVRYIGASLHLATLLAGAGCRRLVVAGTCAEYDADYGYLSESSPTHPATLYAASKVATQTVLAKLAEQLDLSVAWARIFYIYGPGENPRRFVPDIITTLLRGQPTRTTLGEQVRDYLHVEDVASALWALVGSDLAGVVNIGSGAPVTNREIVLKIGEIVGHPELVKLGDLPYRAGDPMFVCANNSRLLRNTDWRPQYDINSGFRQVAAWWRVRLEQKD